MKDIICFLLILFVSCSGSKKVDYANNEQVDVVENRSIVYPQTVSLTEAIENINNDLKLSYFVDRIDYIPLKLTDNYYFKFFRIYGYDEKDCVFILGDLYNILTVDKTGSLIHQIGRKGQGPGEFTQVGNASMDFCNKYIYVRDALSGNILRFDYNGRLLKKMFRLIREEKLTSNVYYIDNNFAAIGSEYIPAVEKIKNRLYGFGVLDTLGSMIHCTPAQSSRFDTSHDRYIQLMNYPFSTQFKNNILLLTSGLADTVYTVENNRIVPRYILDYGNRKPKLEELWIARNSDRDRQNFIRKSIFIMNPAYETGRYFVIKLRENDMEYIVVYDKYKNSNQSVIYSGRNEIINGLNSPTIPIPNFGFINDIDGGIDAYPVIMSSDGNYWISYVDAHVMKNLLTDEYFAKRKDVLNKAQQAKLKELVQSISEEDNQILILMKLKKDVL